MELERLSQMIEELLRDNALRGEIVCRGQEKAIRQFCAKNLQIDNQNPISLNSATIPT